MSTGMQSSASLQKRRGQRFLVRGGSLALVLSCAVSIEVQGQSGSLDWLRCKQTSECVLIKNFCDFPQGVNRAFRQDALKREETLRLGKSMNLGYGCAIPESDPWKGATVACLDNYCMLQYTPPAKPPSLKVP